VRKALGFATVMLLCAAVGAGTVLLAGGKECAEKSAAHAKGAKHECNMTAEECAQEMQKAMATRGWLGIEMDGDVDSAVTISKVVSGSPADQAGFQAGDRLVSINGVEVGEKNAEKVHGMFKKAKIGDQVTYVVSRADQNVTLNATLAKIPDAVLAESIDKHMKEDHASLKK
jgi:C-terminal processing protease CtpA/Prc